MNRPSARGALDKGNLGAPNGRTSIAQLSLAWRLLAPLLIALTLEGFHATAAEQKWAWFSAVSAPSEWSITEGDASVEILGDTFSAKLYFRTTRYIEGNPREEEIAVLTLRGQIKEGRIEAKAWGVEHSPVRLVGVYERIRQPKGEGGSTRETILLLEPGVPAGWTIGLTRGRALP